MRFQLRTSPPRGTVGCVPPFHCVLVFAFLSRPTMVACGRALTLVSLVIASAFSFKSPFFVSPPPATPAVRGRFLTVVCLFIAFFSSRPLRHAGGTREVLDGDLPYYSVYVSFNYFSSRLSRLHSQAVQMCGSGFRGAASSTHDLVSGAGISPNFPYFCICGSSGWASVMVRPWKADNNLRNR